MCSLLDSDPQLRHDYIHGKQGLDCVENGKGIWGWQKMGGRESKKNQDVICRCTNSSCSMYLLYITHINKEKRDNEKIFISLTEHQSFIYLLATLP